MDSNHAIMTNPLGKAYMIWVDAAYSEVHDTFLFASETTINPLACNLSHILLSLFLLLSSSCQTSFRQSLSTRGGNESHQ